SGYRIWWWPFMCVLLAQWIAMGAYTAQGGRIAQVRLPLPTLPISQRSRALAEAVSVILWIGLIMFVMRGLSIVLPTPWRLASVLWMGSQASDIAAAAWVLWPFVAAALFERRWWPGLHVLLGFVAVGFALAGLEVVGHPWWIGLILLGVVLAIGPRSTEWRF